MLKRIVLFILLISFFEVLNASKVTRVIDGDTFEIETGEKVRLIGINAPEISDIFGVESKEYLIQLIEGKDVDLQDDNLSNKTDRYNRLLKYVILNGEDINNKLIINGFAFAYLKYNFEKSELYKESQISASKNGLGMWNNNTKISNSVQNKIVVSESKLISYKNQIILISILVLLFVGIISYFKK
jgi:micrococcal nuclease